MASRTQQLRKSSRDLSLLQSQHQQWVDLIRSWKVYMDYPLQVAFETLVLCNAICDFCPYPVLTDRIGMRMSDSLIEKIVQDLGDIPPEVRFEVNPGGIAERFLDSRMFDILTLINQKLPAASVSLTSNGSPLIPRNLERLMKIRNIVMLNVSLNEFRAEEYTKMMGLPFERTVSNLKALHELKVTQRANFTVHLSRVGDGTEEDDLYVQWVKEEFPEFKPVVLVRGDWRGSINSLIPLEPAPAIQCSQWFKLRFWADGKAAFCCADVRPTRDLGDVSVQHVLEIYNSPERRRLRSEVTSRLEVEECRRCPMLV